MTKEEVKELYVKIIMEYGIKDNSQTLLADSLITDFDISIAEKEAVLFKIIESDQSNNLVMNNLHFPSYAESITVDHLFAMLEKETKTWIKRGIFYMGTVDIIIGFLNNNVDFETGRLKAEYIDRIRELDRQRTLEIEQWKWNNGQIWVW